MEQWSEEALRLETPSPCTDKTLPALGAGAQLSRLCYLKGFACPGRVAMSNCQSCSDPQGFPLVP